MGMASKEQEKQMEDYMRTGEFCEICGEELTKEELEYAEKTGRKICFNCQRDWEKIQDE